MNPATRKVTRLTKLRTKLNKHVAAVTQLLVLVIFAVFVANSLRGISVLSRRVNELANTSICTDERVNKRVNKLGSILNNNTRMLLNRDEILVGKIKESQRKNHIEYQIVRND